MASRSANLFELLRDAGEGEAPKKRKEDPSKKAAEPKVAAPAKPAAPKAAKKAESPAVKPAQPKAAPSKAAAKPAAAPAKAATGGAVSSADKKPRADRPAREGGNNNRPRGEGRPPRENREVREGGEGAPRRERRDREKENRGRSDVVKEDKGFVQIAKRTHDRRPGTGRPGNENKKGGAGKGNWGKVGSELESAEQSADANEQTEETTAEVKTEETKEEAPQAPKVLTPEEEEALKEKEREERMVTLEEYKKKTEEDKANLPLPALRKAGEGVNQDKWASYKKLEKDANESLFSVSQKGKGNKAAPAATPKKPASVVPVTDVLGFKQERKPERGPRESRGGRRGDFPKSGRTGGNKTEFSLSDQAFPALNETTKA